VLESLAGLGVKLFELSAVGVELSLLGLQVDTDIVELVLGALVFALLLVELQLALLDAGLAALYLRQAAGWPPSRRQP